MSLAPLPSTVDRIGRAIRAQLASLTGDRAVGSARVRSLSGDVLLPPNTYALPVDGGQLREELPVKVRHNPTTVSEHLVGGDWTVGESGTEVTFIANSGGARCNFPAGTLLRFSPPVPGVEPVAEVVEDFTGGTSGHVKQIVVFDDIANANEELALFQAKVSAVPALVLAWMQSTPVEGRTGGLSQGATRKGRGARAYYETFALYTITANAESHEARRNEGLRIMEAANALLTDRRVNDDGETLSALGTGVEILSSARLTRRESGVRFVTTLRVISILASSTARTFRPWATTQITSFAPAEPPAHNDELVVHAPIDEMPQE